jgi:hypothetical protein
MEERRSERQYPEFVIGIDPATGQAIRHTCDPDQLGTYFDKDGSRLHYLTPVYFSPNVLGRYISEPTKYSVTRNRLTCLDLWGLDIGRSTTGHVEVYLGDLGRDLPEDEWPHWLAHNALPSGSMAEDRFRRDFLNQWASSPDPVSKLHRAHQAVDDASEELLGARLWKRLDEQTRTQYEHLHGPVGSDPMALESPILTLCKALVDAIDVKVLRKYLDEKDTQLGSLQLLERVVEQLGGDKAMLVGPLRGLYSLRSGGGIAHLSGSDRQKLLAKLQLVSLSPPEIFEEMCGRLTISLERLRQLFSTT